jgi:hypothetical protein
MEKKKKCRDRTKVQNKKQNQQNLCKDKSNIFHQVKLLVIVDKSMLCY